MSLSFVFLWEKALRNANAMLQPHSSTTIMDTGTNVNAWFLGENMFFL